MKTIVFALLVATVFSNAVFDKVLLTNYTDSLCLDGSPAAYYIQIGNNPNQFMLYFEGGAWCGQQDLSSTTQSCYERSKTDLGSSKNYPDQLTFTEGFFSNNQKNRFKDATKVLLKYCDGAGHQGYRANPINYKDTKLYFHGQRITKNQLDDIEAKHGLFSKGTQIIISGGSAGGLAAFQWSDYILSKANTRSVAAFPDAGIFLDVPNVYTNKHQFRNKFENLLKISNTDANIPATACVQANPNDQVKCMFATQIVKTMKTPVFAVQSLYDTWSIPNILGVKCIVDDSLQKCSSQERQYIEQYHDLLQQAVKSLVVKSVYNGYWAPACAFHVTFLTQTFYSPYYRIPQNSDYSQVNSFMIFLSNRQPRIYMDQQPWPSNRNCAGLNQLQQE